MFTFFDLFRTFQNEFRNFLTFLKPSTLLYIISGSFHNILKSFKVFKLARSETLVCKRQNVKKLQNFFVFMDAVTRIIMWMVNWRINGKLTKSVDLIFLAEYFSIILMLNKHLNNNLQVYWIQKWLRFYF